MWLLSPTAMIAILADTGNRTASVKVTVMRIENRDSILKNGIWFGGKGHCTNGYIEIYPDTLCAICYH